jgi:hypothetical protein
LGVVGFQVIIFICISCSNIKVHIYIWDYLFIGSLSLGRFDKMVRFLDPKGKLDYIYYSFWAKLTHISGIFWQILKHWSWNDAGIKSWWHSGRELVLVERSFPFKPWVCHLPWSFGETISLLWTFTSSSVKWGWK